MQDFYGIATSENKNYLFSMKKSVGAILWYCTDFNDQETHHQFCPQGSDIWCKYQKYKSIDSLTMYRESINIPKSIFEIVNQYL